MRLFLVVFSGCVLMALGACSKHEKGDTAPAEQTHAEPAEHEHDEPAEHEHAEHEDDEPAGHEHAGHDHAGHDHAEPAGHDHAGHDHAEHADPKGLVALSLNDGKKWPTDESTRTSVVRLDERLEAGASEETVAAYQALGRDLSAELSVLVKGCTMQGPAHDQLHVFLGAVFPRVSALQKGETLPELKATVTQLNTIFARYHETFE